MNSQPSSDSYRWTVLCIIMLGSFTALLTSSVVNVAIPRIMGNFGINRGQAEWISTSFMLTSAVAMPLVGWSVDRFGHKAFYLAALSIFVLGTALCALAWDFNTLIMARTVQAIGGGAMQPAGMAIVAILFKPEERGRAMGVYAMGMMAGPALGPTLGGFLTEWFSWRAVFSINIPPGLLTLFLGVVFIKKNTSIPKIKRPFDFGGYIFLGMALVGGLLAFADGQERGWTSAYIVINLACAIGGLTMFLAIEATIKHPLLDLKIFRYRNYSLSMILSIVRSVGLFGGIFFLPLFLQNLSGYTPIMSGLFLMPSALTMTIMMPIAGRLADRFDIRLLSTIGALTAGLALMAYARLDPLSGKAIILIPQMLRGLGLSFLMAPLMAVAINAVPTHMVPTASSFLSIAMSLGGSFGISMLNTSITNSVANYAARLSEQTGVNSEMFSLLSLHLSRALGRYSGALPEGGEQYIGMALPLREVFFRAQVLGFQDAFVLSGLILMMVIPLCLMLKPGQFHESAAG